MDRAEALVEAVRIVEEMGNKEPQNSRGYKIDGWKPPTTEERTKAILEIAAFLVSDKDDE